MRKGKRGKFQLAQCTVVLLLVALQLTAGFIAAPSVAARNPVTYHVNGRLGNDRNNGRSALFPWRTIAQANALVQPGDTVIIYNGTYQESIAPVFSGTADQRITYKAAPNHKVYVEGVELLLNLIQRSYITVEGIIFQNPTGAWGEIQDGHFNEIIGNTFIGNGPTPYYAGLYLYYGSTYNRIVNNEFRNWGDRATQWGDAIRLSRDADFTLIENNRFINAGHSLIGIDTSFNVIRNNYFENAWHKGIDMVWRVNPPWSPGDEFVARRNVLEKNMFVRCKLGATGEKGGVAVQMGSAETIFRHNVLVENERTGVIINGWTDAPKPYGNRLYHNTFVNNGTAEEHAQASAIFVTQWGIPQVDISDNVIKNNIICKNNAREHQLLFNLYPHERYSASYYKNSYMIAGNAINRMPIMEIMGLEGPQVVTYYQQRYPQFVMNNREAEPQFVDMAAENYQLKNNSPAIDAAVSLTSTTSSGFGTTVAVEDASYFSDGYGLVPGDEVKIGSNPAVTVLNVDVEHNTLTLARTVRWTQGTPVYLGDFNGAAPDIGAFESTYAPPPPSKSITVVSPNGGEEWTLGQVATIQWDSTNVDGMVKIELSRNGGTNFELLAASVINNGRHDWLVTGVTTSRAVIRITSHESLSVADTSDAAFTIKESSQPPAITVLTPNGGEEWLTGEVATIRWNSTNLRGAVKVELSRNGGASFEMLFAGTPDDGQEEWLVSGPPTAKAMIRISSTSTRSVFDSSDAVFTIKDPPPPPQPMITVLSPNGGEEWKLGQTQTIRWTSANVTGNVLIQFSRDGGRRYRVIAKSVPNTGSYDWKPTGLGSQKALIEIISVEDSSVRDQSDAVFVLKR